MKEYGQVELDRSFNVQPVLQMIRAAGAVIGLVVMVIGVVYATQVFSMVSTALHDPGGFEAVLKPWVAAVGGDQLDLVVPDITTYHAANLVALAVLGVGTMILVRISMGLILVGAKVLSWSLSDRIPEKRHVSNNAARRS